MPRTTSSFSLRIFSASSAFTRRLALALRVGVGAQRVLQLGGDADVIDHQPARLVLEDAVHAGDGLHEVVAVHRLVHIHRVAAGRVEAGEPHVAHDHDLERVVRVLEPPLQPLLLRLGVAVRLQVRPYRRRCRS